MLKYQKKYLLELKWLIIVRNSFTCACTKCFSDVVKSQISFRIIFCLVSTLTEEMLLIIYRVWFCSCFRWTRFLWLFCWSKSKGQSFDFIKMLGTGLTETSSELYISGLTSTNQTFYWVFTNPSAIFPLFSQTFVIWILFGICSSFLWTQFFFLDCI